jgi:hypothetical protein
MSKSQTRNTVLAEYPKSVCVDAAPAAIQDVGYVFHDSMQALKSAYVEGMANWEGFVYGMQKECMLSFERYPNVHTFVMCFDNYDRVPLAKACEQLSRSKRNSAGEGAGALREFSVGPLSASIPDAYGLATHDRNYWCREIIRFVVKSWATAPVPDGSKKPWAVSSRPRIPVGKSLIVDGHYLDYGDLDDIGVAVHPGVPLQISCIGNNEAHLVSFRPDLAHTLGEGDLGMVWLMEALVPKAEFTQVAVLSIDSDMMWNLLRYLEVTEKNVGIVWRYWPGLTWCVSTNPFSKMTGRNIQKWCDINVLQSSMRNDPRLACIAVEDRVASLTVVCAASGNDYVDATALVPGHYWLATYFNNAPRIGSMVGPLSGTESDTAQMPLVKPLSIKRLSYYRLVECASRQAAKGKRGTYYCNFDPASETYSYPTNAPPRMPSMRDMKHTLAHVSYVVQMMNHLGLNHYKEPNLSHYGYGRLNVSLPPSRTNIKRLHGTDETDTWAMANQPQPPPMALPGIAVNLRATAATATKTIEAGGGAAASTFSTDATEVTLSSGDTDADALLLDAQDLSVGEIVHDVAHAVVTDVLSNALTAIGELDRTWILDQSDDLLATMLRRAATED